MVNKFQIKIRKFKLSDAVSVASLHRNTIRAVNSKDYPPENIRIWSGRTSAKGFRESASKCFRWVALDQEKIVGFADISKEGKFWGLYVHKNYIRKGIGTKLIQKVEEKAKALGVKRLKVQATLTARTFYKKHGYKVRKKALHKVSHKGETVMISIFQMEKNLERT